MSEELSDEADDRSASPRWAGYLWLLAIVIALAVFELFNQPFLLGPTVALKFAWGDILTARWLWKRDPNRRRGRAYLCLYFSHGLWKSALVAFLLMFVFVFLVPNKKQGGVQPPNAQQELAFRLFGGAILGAILLAFMASILSGCALVHAFRTRAKMWLASTVAADRVRDRWPPQMPGENKIARNAAAMVFTFGFVLAIVVCIVAAAVAEKANADLRKGIFTVGVFGPIIALPILVLGLRDWANRKLRAASPYEGWPPGETDTDSLPIE